MTSTPHDPLLWLAALAGVLVAFAFATGLCLGQSLPHLSDAESWHLPYSGIEIPVDHRYA